MVQDVELDEEKFAFDEKDDVFSISNVLKQCGFIVLNNAWLLTDEQISASCQSLSSTYPTQSESSTRKIAVCDFSGMRLRLIGSRNACPQQFQCIPGPAASNAADPPNNFPDDHWASGEGTKSKGAEQDGRKESSRRLR